MVKKALLASIVSASSFVSADVLPPTLPPWKPTYDISMSSISMQCNSSGYSNPARGAEFGIMSYDWSNTKKDWAAATPMTCEENLQTQAEMTKASTENPNQHTFVYRNIVKALPWFSSVRKILDDPAYELFFLKFNASAAANGDLHVPNCAPEDASKCSIFYHDQEQTPEVVDGDGACPPESGCDCGTQPCGEYLFDHRNGTMLQTWLIENHIITESGLKNAAIEGVFMDDFWCSDILTPGCNDPVQGATEIDANQQIDMGLSDDDIKDLTLAWQETMGLVQQAILDNGGYTWSLIDGQGNANASPHLLTTDSCIADLREACSVDSVWQKNSKLFGLTVGENNTNPQLVEDVAFFLLARGDYSYLGWGVWGMTWPFNPEPAHGTVPPSSSGVPKPDEISVDYGMPVKDLDGVNFATCYETDVEGVFQRAWTSGIVRLDCNNFVGALPTPL